MSIGNQEFGIPTKKIPIPIRYLVFMSKISWYFLGILSVILSTTLLKFGLILVFFGRIKIGLVFGFCGCHFIGIGLVSVCHFPENGISIGVSFPRGSPGPSPPTSGIISPALLSITIQTLLTFLQSGNIGCARSCVFGIGGSFGMDHH